MIIVELESLDNKVITPRTGKTKVIAETTHLPIEGKRQSFIYLNEDCESPGVYIETNGIEQMGNEIKFFDYEKRPFKLKVMNRL